MGRECEGVRMEGCKSSLSQYLNFSQSVFVLLLVQKEMPEGGHHKPPTLWVLLLLEGELLLFDVYMRTGTRPFRLEAHVCTQFNIQLGMKPFIVVSCAFILYMFYVTRVVLSQNMLWCLFFFLMKERLHDELKVQWIRRPDFRQQKHPSSTLPVKSIKTTCTFNLHLLSVGVNMYEIIKMYLPCGTSPSPR